MPSTDQTNRTPQPAIAKTRQRTLAKEPAAFPPQVGPPRGVLNATEDRGHAFFHQRLAPPPSLAPFVQHYWYVQWDLRNQPPAIAETLPHPNAYLVFEHDLLDPRNDKAEVSGVTTGKFSRTMQGHGRVFGLKFRPGGLRPFLTNSASTLTDRIVPAEQIFTHTIRELAQQLRTLATPEAMAEATTTHFASCLPQQDANSTRASELVDLILNDPTLLTVETLATRTGLTLRTLQRLFKDYVGAPPKWVIRRYRLHELLETFNAQLNSGTRLDFAQLALALGYTDQAHLINDFRTLTNYTPTEYLKRTEAAR